MSLKGHKQQLLASKLLSVDENAVVSSTVGGDVDVIAVGVVQLLKAARSGWSKVLIGVACFVKDWIRKGYYIRVFIYIFNFINSKTPKMEVPLSKLEKLKIHKKLLLPCIRAAI